MKSIPSLSLEQLYPPACDGINLNTCHDPDCGNHDMDADFSSARVHGPNAKARLEKTCSNSDAVGLGKYHLDSNNQERRISTAFEYTGDPHT